MGKVTGKNRRLGARRLLGMLLSCVTFLALVSGTTAFASEHATKVKNYLIETVRGGGKPIVPVSLAPGKTTPSTILSIDENGLRISAQGAELDLTWKMVGEEKGLYEMARPLILDAPVGVHAAYLQWGIELGQVKEPGFRTLLGKLWEKDPAAARKVEDGLPSGTAVSSTGPERTVSKKAVPVSVPDYLKVKDLTPVKGLDPVKHEPIVLVRDGAPLSKVYVAEAKPGRNTQIMVQELVDSIKLTTGAELQVIRHSPAPPPAGGSPVIVIGDCAASRAAGIDASKIPVEGFVVRTTSDRIFLVGSTMPIPELGGWPPKFGADGTAWAIADFLERCVGVRWYWPVAVGGRSLEPSRNLAINPIHYTDAPVFRWREYYPASGFAPELWVARTGEGGANLPKPTARAIPAGIKHIDLSVLLAGLRAGNSWPYQIDCHRPGQLWQNDALVKKYPNLRAWTDGKGGRATSLLCYSAQETFDFLAAGAEAVWDKKTGNLPQDPWCGFGVTWVTDLTLNVSPFDQPVDCQCPACQQSFKDGGANKHMARFVKRICEEVKRRWPTKKVGYLPYWNYRWCNGEVTYPDNLEIRLADTQGGEHWCKTKGWDDGHEERVSLWAKKTASGKVVTWEYPIAITAKSHAPFQFPHALKEYYMRRRNDCAGSFLNGHCLGEWSNHAPTLYCWMKLLWNPELDVDAVIDEFCRRMFEQASKEAREFMVLSCQAFEGKGIHVANGDGTENLRGIKRLYPAATVRRMAELVEVSKQRLEKDPVALQRLEYFTWTFEHFLSAYGR